MGCSDIVSGIGVDCKRNGVDKAFGQRRPCRGIDDAREEDRRFACIEVDRHGIVNLFDNIFQVGDDGGLNVVSARRVSLRGVPSRRVRLANPPVKVVSPAEYMFCEEVGGRVVGVCIDDGNLIERFPWAGY